LGALVFGGLAGLVPPVAGLTVLLDPLRRGSDGAGRIRVATLDALPGDGTPRRFPVLATRRDAWNRTPHTPVGAVYLRRTGPDRVQAVNVVCPHAGCLVDFAPASHRFLCPCHRSSFEIDGRVADPHSPSPRGLDELEVEIRAGAEIWVRFQNFQVGRPEKRPLG
jgi:Rieske Fe-S protein